jgi:hypothetical protein
MKEAKEYSYNKNYKKLFLITGLFGLGFAVIFFMLSLSEQSHSTPVPIALIFPIILYFLFRNYIIFKIYDDYFELRIAPLRAIEIIKFDELENIEISGKRMYFYRKNKKKLSIHLNSIDADKREALIEFFQRKVKNEK